MSKIDFHPKRIKNFPVWIIPAILSLMLFSLNSLSTSPDTGTYLNAALDIVNHKTINQIDSRVFERRPLFSIFIALSFWFFGVSVRNAFWIIRFFFLLNIMSIFFIGSKLFNKWVGLFASVFLLTSLSFNEWSSYLLIDNILPFFLLWHLFFIFLGIKKNSIRYFILATLILIPSFFLREKTIILISVPFLSFVFSSIFTKKYKTKKVLSLLICSGIALFVVYFFWASIIYFSSGHIYTPFGNRITSEHINIAKILLNNPFLKLMFSDKAGSFSLISFINHLYNFYAKFISPNFHLLTELLLLFGWGLSIFSIFKKSKPDIFLSVFFFISIPILAYIGNPESHSRFGHILFPLCLSSLVIGRLIDETIKKIFLIFKKIKIFNPKLISSFLVVLIISSVFGTQISQSWLFYKTRVSLFSGNWGFTVDAWHNENIKNMSTWISNNIPENSRILASIWWGKSFYFFTKGKYPIEVLRIDSKKNINELFDRNKLLFFDCREDFLDINFPKLDENDFLELLTNTSPQYILITPPDNLLLSYLDNNDSFEKLHEIRMYPNPGRITLYKVLDIKPKVDYQGVINRAMMILLNNIYETDRNKFSEIKERILIKGLGWSDEDVEMRLIRKIPSNLVNLELNNKIEFFGYDLCPITKPKFENLELDNKKYQKENFLYKSNDSSAKEGSTKEIPLLKLGEKFDLIFYWKCLEKIDHRYAVWAALNKGYDSIELGHILVDESEYPTTRWNEGEVIRDICQFRVPDYIDPGVYEFKMSLYDINEAKEVTPFTSVGKIKISPPLEGAISRIREYSELGFRMNIFNEYIEIIKSIDKISYPENKKLLLYALKELEIYSRSDPQNIYVVCYIGIVYEKLQNLKKAEELLKKVLGNDKNHNLALIELGRIYYLEKKYQLAAEFLEKVPWEQENNFEAGILLREVYNKLGNTEKVTEIEEKLKRISENSVQKSKWDVRGIKSSTPYLPWQNVNIGKKIFLYGDPIKLTLKAKGKRIENFLPHLTIWLDDKLLYEGYLKNEEWNDLEFLIKDIKPAEHILKIWKRDGGPLYIKEQNLIQINPAVDVKLPGEGSVLYMGEGMEIKWIPPDGVTKVIITLHRGKDVERLLANPTENDGEHWWKIHTNLRGATNYRIKIESDFYIGYSGYFSIERKR